MTNICNKLRFGIFAAVLMAALSTFVISQPAITERIAKANLSDLSGNDTSEKSIMVDGGVNVSMCVTEGNLKVNGWNRKEVRVLIKDGSKFNFKVLQKDPHIGNPVWITLTGLENTKGKDPKPTECVWGDVIEMDIPIGATINIKGHETTTTIDNVKKVSVKNIGGNISLRNIRNGINASTYEGDVTVEASAGEMTLESSTGNIIAFEAAPSEIGDIFKAKTNSGAISLQHLEYRQIEVNSISGSVVFNGTILSGGSYGFSTSNGSIRLSLPLASSFRISASYGFGTFSTELPIKIITEDVHPGPVKSINGSLGTGDATLRLTTNNGSVAIKKQ